jgi:hypothetical protein
MFWASKQPHSLALRLSAWYAGSAFLLLAAGTGFLYWELVQNSNEEDDQYLWEKVNTLGKLVTERDFRTLKWEVEGESSVRPAVEVLSRVFAGDGRILVESSGMSEQLAPQIFPKSDRPEYRTVGKRIFRVLSVQGSNYALQVGLEVRHPPRSGWLDELGRLKDGRSMGLGVARCAPDWLVQNCPAAPSAVSCSRMYVRTCSSSNPTVDTA